MKKILLLISFICLGIVSGAQDNDVYRTFVSKISDSRQKFEYSFSSGFQTKLTGKGTAIVQGSCFRLDGDGLEIYCDGQSAVTMDRAAKEVIVESLEFEQGNYVNPAMLLSSIDKAFRCKSQSPANYAGRESVKVILEPRRQCNLSRITLYLSKGGNSLYGASVSMDDGSSTDFFLPSFSILPCGSLDDFRVDLKSLGKGYIITDLR